MVHIQIINAKSQNTLREPVTRNAFAGKEYPLYYLVNAGTVIPFFF